MLVNETKVIFCKKNTNEYHLAILPILVFLQAKSMEREKSNHSFAIEASIKKLKTLSVTNQSGPYMLDRHGMIKTFNG